MLTSSPIPAKLKRTGWPPDSCKFPIYELHLKKRGRKELDLSFWIEIQYQGQIKQQVWSIEYMFGGPRY